MLMPLGSPVPTYKPSALPISTIAALQRRDDVDRRALEHRHAADAHADVGMDRDLRLGS